MFRKTLARFAAYPLEERDKIGTGWGRGGRREEVGCGGGAGGGGGAHYDKGRQLKTEQGR